MAPGTSLLIVVAVGVLVALVAGRIRKHPVPPEDDDPLTRLVDEADQAWDPDAWRGDVHTDDADDWKR